MSKGQRGNKEAKKPKKVPAPVGPPDPAGALPAQGVTEQTRSRRSS